MIPVEPSYFVGSSQVVMFRDGDVTTPMIAEVDDHGLVLTEWQLTPLEIERLLAGGHLKVWMRVQDRDDFPPLDLEVSDPLPVTEES